MSSAGLIGFGRTPNIGMRTNSFDVVNAPAGVYFGQVLSTDTIGTATVTFTGVNANSEIRVYLPDATEAAGVETCDADHVLTWGVYPSGSANNTVTIRIVNTAYKIKEFNYTSVAGTQSLPVQQELDHWYSNPA